MHVSIDVHVKTMKQGLQDAKWGWAREEPPLMIMCFCDGIYLASFLVYKKLLCGSLTIFFPLHLFQPPSGI